MIPQLVDIPRCPLKLLPVGIHLATLDEIKATFATNPTRNHLFNGLHESASYLFRLGSENIFLDGSYVTDKPNPGDFDAAWDMNNVDLADVDQLFLHTDKDSRKKMKKKYGGEFFPVCGPIFSAPILKFFQTDRFTNSPKGIIRIINPATHKEAENDNE